MERLQGTFKRTCPCIVHEGGVPIWQAPQGGVMAGPNIDFGCAKAIAIHRLPGMGLAVHAVNNDRVRNRRAMTSPPSPARDQRRVVVLAAIGRS